MDQPPVQGAGVGSDRPGRRGLIKPGQVGFETWTDFDMRIPSCTLSKVNKWPKDPSPRWLDGGVESREAEDDLSGSEGLDVSQWDLEQQARG